MRTQALALAVSAAFAAMASPQAMAVDISGDSRFDYVTSHPAEIEANILADKGCEILITYEWQHDPSRAIIIPPGQNGRFRYEAWEGGDLYNTSTSAPGAYSARLTFDYLDSVGEDGVRFQRYTAYFSFSQIGPFSVGQSFALVPAADDPGAATTTLTATLTASDIAAATKSGNAGYDEYQAQCGL